MRPARDYGPESNLITRNHARILSGHISYGSAPVNTDLSRNIDGVWATVADTGTANTTFSVTHVLGRVPIGFHVMRNNTAGVVYDSGTAWTSTTMSLKCSVAHAALTLFLV
jgi:hypothetical protein